jgi:hypothetical protein
MILKGVFQEFDKFNRNPTSYWKEVQKTFKRKVKIKKIFNE